MRYRSSNIDQGGNERLLKLLIIISAALLVIVPAAALIISFQNDDGQDVRYIDETGSPTGDMSMDTGSKEAWEQYLSSAPTIEFEFDGPSSSIRSEVPNIDDNLPSLNDSGVEYKESDQDSYDRSDDGSGAPQDPASKNSDDDDMSLDDGAEGSGDEREVEESDIVKAVGDRLYVLNSFRGLMVVNLEDPEAPFVEGSVQVLGYPISMYVVDFLGFVIVSGAPTLDGTGEYSGMMYVIDLLDNSAPRIVKMVELEGYPVDSRRVGEVIYIISNEYGSYYYYGDMPMMEREVMDDGVDMVYTEEEKVDEGPKTHVTSFGFYDPSEIGQRDKVTIDGNAGLVYASSFAIYIPQLNNDYSNPKTTFTYVDISDPKGDINIRGQVTVPGLLMDRYQMDHYKGTFRVVTQKWPSDNRWEDLPMSTLYVIDARNPDDLKKVSSLLIDDSGNLMATRFAGDRAYTIHLPRTIDPLDVIDLSNPMDPKLTDVLELPGWVEHMEVIGKDIIAVGVDDTSDDGWKVALSLFDVTDPYNAVLDDRITIGEGYTYSSANYDPKALTILEDQGLVLIPFDSYNWRTYNGDVHGVQVVSFDLDEGTLEEIGSIVADDSVLRTRWINDAVVTMSQRMVMTVDIAEEGPVVLGRVELASNIADAFFSDGMLVTLLEPYYGEDGATIRISEPDTPYIAIKEISIDGLEYVQMDRLGEKVFLKGIRQEEGEVPVSEIHMYDLSDPLAPVHYGPAEVQVPESYYSYNYYYDEKPIRDDDSDVEEVEKVEEGQIGEISIWYDPFGWKILDDGSVAMYLTEYSYSSSVYRSRTTIHVMSWGATGSEIASIVLDREDDYITDISGNEDRIFVASQLWWPPSTRITEISNVDGSLSVSGRFEVTGSFLGVSTDLKRVYTQATYWDDDEVHYKLIIYGLSGDGVVLLQSMEVGSPVSSAWFTGDSIVVVSQNWDYWWGPYYGYGYLEDDVDYEDTSSSDDGEDVKEGSDTDGEISYEVPSGDSKDEYPGGEEVPEGTKIILITLEEGLFGETTSLQLETNAYVSLSTDEMIVLNSGMTHTVVSLEGDSMKELGTWFGNGWVSGGDLDEDLLVLAMGMYGIEVKDL